jgi:two-component sensor histidine kinase/tetratricopeptide (TPR) repeat protein
MKQIFLIFFFQILFFVPSAYAANPPEKTSSQLLDSSIRLWKLNQYDDALKLANQASLQAKRDKDSLQEAKCITDIGLIYSSKGDPVKSIFYYEQSISILRQLKNGLELSVSLLNLGIAYKEQGIYDKALFYLFESSTYFEQVKDFKRLSSAYNTIGNIFRIEENYPKALDYLFHSLKIRRQIQFEEGIASSLNNIGTVYKMKGLYDSALYYFQASLELKLVNSRPEKLANTYSQIAEVYAFKNNYELARQYYFDSYNIRKEADNETGIARSLYELGSLYFDNRDFSNAATYLLQGAEAAEKVGVKDLLLKCYDKLKQLYEIRHNDSKSLFYANKYIVLNDLLLGEQKQKAVTQMEIKYETEKKQYEIQALNHENERKKAIYLAQKLQLEAKSNHNKQMVFGIIGLFLIIILLLILFRNKLHFAKKLDMIMREVHHRVMNNFQLLLSLSSLQLDVVKEQAARKMVLDNSSRITAMMLIHRELYLDRDITRVNISNYIRLLVDNLLTAYELEEKHIHIHYSISPGIEMNVDKAISLGLLINELITNAFKYAFGHDNMNPQLDITLEKQNDQTYLLMVRDNGPGMPVSDGKKSLGLRLAESQVKRLKGAMKISYDSGLTYEISFK